MSANHAVPALFIGHGSPTITMDDNVYTRAWSTLGKRAPRPRAVLCVSAHWYKPATQVTGAHRPRTIHDFGGFPETLYAVRYPAPGDPALARQVIGLLSPEQASLDSEWGLDHGTWSVLRHMYPEADIPVVQLSVNSAHGAAWHFELAQRLRPLRNDNVLVVGSGNLVHNLRAYVWGQRSADPHDWAFKFETAARQWMSAANFEPLINYKAQGPAAMMAVPTPDHYLPLLYILAQYREGDSISFPVEGFDGGSMSMLAVQIG